MAERRALGCEVAQGYFFSRPRPPSALGDFLGPLRRRDLELPRR